MKFTFQLIAGLITLLGLATGNYQISIIAYGLSACLMKPTTVLGLYAVPCVLGAITTDDDCGSKGGIADAYWTKYDNVAWSTMAGNVLNFDPTSLLILDYVMTASNVFTQLEFKVEDSTYDFTFTEEADAYDQLIKFVFEGKSNAQTTAFRKAVGCCKILLHIIDVNGLERVVGVEWNGTAFVKQLKTLRVVRHLDTSGQLGQSRARDEMDLGGKSVRPPLYATVGAANIPV
jgi:hypothetical protein